MAWPLLLAIGLLCTASVLALKMSAPEQAQAQEMHIAIGAGAHVRHRADQLPVDWAGSICGLGLVVVLLAAVLLTAPVKGSTRWFVVPGTTDTQLQPSELAKMAFVLALAWYLRFRKDRRELTGLIVPFLIMLVPMGLILIEPDLGTASCFHRRSTRC